MATPLVSRAPRHTKLSESGKSRHENTQVQFTASLLEEIAELHSSHKGYMWVLWSQWKSIVVSKIIKANDVFNTHVYALRVVIIWQRGLDHGGIPENTVKTLNFLTLN